MKNAHDPVPALKRQLADALIRRIGPLGYPFLALALRVDYPRASNIYGGRLERFSLQQLVRFAARLDGVVTLEVKWTTPALRLIGRRERVVRESTGP